MVIKRSMIAAALALAVLAPFAAQAGKAEDTKITAEVKALFAKTPDIPVNQVDVSTHDNIVELSGFLDTTLQVNKAVELAYSIGEVKDVDTSRLETKSSESFLKDAMTTAKVKGKILQLSNNRRISPNYDLHVETINGQVHVHGKVANKKDIKTIEQALMDINSVKQVKTSINT